MQLFPQLKSMGLFHPLASEAIITKLPCTKGNGLVELFASADSLPKPQITSDSANEREAKLKIGRKDDDQARVPNGPIPRRRSAKRSSFLSPELHWKLAVIHRLRRLSFFCKAPVLLAAYGPLPTRPPPTAFCHVFLLSKSKSCTFEFSFEECS